jgi:hypothetical protein
MADLHTKMAHLIEVTAAQLDDTNQKLAAAQASQDAYATKVPEVVDSLIAMGYLQKTSRAVAIQKLAEPSQALDQLVKLAAASMQDPEHDTSTLGTAVATAQEPQVPATTKRASRKRWGEHGDTFIRNLGLDPAAL